MFQNALYDDTGLVKTIFVERVSGGVEYREEAPDGTILVQRAATGEEKEQLRAKLEADERTNVRDRAEQAVDQLETIASSSGDLTQTQLSDAVRLLARVLAALIRFVLRKIDVQL